MNNKLITPLFLFTLAVSFLAISASCSKPETPVEKRPESTMPSGPLIDTGLTASGNFRKEIESINNPEELARLGDKYFENNRYPEAIEAYEKTLKLNPKDADTYNDLGLAFHYTAKPEKAVETLRKGTEVDPSFQRVWLSLGFVLAATGKGEEAKPALNKTVALDPNSTQGVEAKRLLGLINTH
ncbi:MAG: tetratricopeptide repeat protein [Nitrospirae bacterium]|nr:tetratricopeptide repeat protein [Nitrospirota bacterium]